MPVIGPENALLRFGLSHLPGCGECLRGPAISVSLGDSSEEAGHGYNPLVLVGDEGSGKSEFLAFVARRWFATAGLRETDPEAARRVLRWTGKGLAVDLRAGLDGDNWHRLHGRFQSAELLLVDGLDQCLDPDGLDAFASLLDLITAGGGRVVVALSHLPAENPAFPRSLVTRLSEGLVVKVHPAEPPSRRAIVRCLARRRGIVIDEAAIVRLASRETDSGSLDRTLAAIASCGVKRIESRHVTGPLADGSSRQNLSPRRIITVTARQHGLRHDDLVGQSRHRRVAHARSMAIYLVRRLTGKSLVEIGACFGGRDHTTILHSVRVVKRRHETDSDCRRTVEALLARLTE